MVVCVAVIVNKVLANRIPLGSLAKVGFKSPIAIVQHLSVRSTFQVQIEVSYGRFHDALE
jgi:hypothetical protein